MLVSLLSKLKAQQNLIVAHRGASGNFVENTIEAFSKAVEFGADMIELDIRATKDGKIICYHDAVINNLKIEEQDFAGLSKHSIPLLSDVLAEFHDKIYFVIELKQFSGIILKQFSKLIADYDLFGKVIFASEKAEYLQHIKQEFGNNAYCCVVFNAVASSKDLMNYAILDGIICHVEELDSSPLKNMQVVWQSGVSTTEDFDIVRPVIGVYGVKTAEHVATCHKHGVRFIGTDYPIEVRKMLQTNFNS